MKILDKSNDLKYKSLKHEANVLNLPTEHDNIIRILKIADCKTYAAIIMEFYDGFDLQHILDHYNVHLIYRLKILSDVASALIFCHENNIIHADIKPLNILVAVNIKDKLRSFQCKLFDFGCSLLLNQRKFNLNGVKL